MQVADTGPTLQSYETVRRRTWKRNDLPSSGDEVRLLPELGRVHRRVLQAPWTWHLIYFWRHFRFSETERKQKFYTVVQGPTTLLAGGLLAGFGLAGGLVAICWSWEAARRRMIVHRRLPPA